jgi:predicted DNA-binding transcriptional regulator AlpA
MQRVLRTPDAAKYVGLEPSTLEKMRIYGGGPRYIRLGARAVGYDLRDLDEFIEAGRRQSTADPGEAAIKLRPGHAGPPKSQKRPGVQQVSAARGA